MKTTGRHMMTHAVYTLTMAACGLTLSVIPASADSYSSSTFSAGTGVLNVVAVGLPPSSSYPVVPLNISGIMNYQVGAGTNPLLKATVTTKSMIALYNKSVSFLSYATNSIPTGSAIVWDPAATNAANSLLIANNSKDFKLPLDDGGTNHFGSMWLPTTNNGQIGVYKLNSNTSAGTETDLMAIRFALNDDNGTKLNLTVQNSLNWKYSPAVNSVQKATLSMSISGAGGIATVASNPAVISLTASGKATGTNVFGIIPYLNNN